MAKQKKISISRLEKVLAGLEGAPKILPVGKAGETEEIVVTPLLSLEKQAQLAVYIANSVFTEDTDGQTQDKQISYAPYYYDIACMTGVLKYYTNIRTDNPAKLYMLCIKGGLFEKIVQLIDPRQYAAVTQAAQQLIAYRQRSLLASESTLLYKAVSTLQAREAELVQLTEKMERFFSAQDPVQTRESIEVLRKISSFSKEELAAAALSLKTPEDHANMENAQSAGA